MWVSADSSFKPTDRGKPCTYIKQKNRSPFGKYGKYGKYVTTGAPVFWY